MKKRTYGKKILLSILIIVIFISAVLTYINWSLKPLPEEKRNISTTDIKMLADIPDVANRTPIIRTYTKEEYDNFNENELKKIKKTVSGNIEGDVPALKIEKGTGIIENSFEMIEKNNDFTVTAKIVPDDIPKIKILALETLYSKEKPKEINDSLIKGEVEGTYLYEINRYFNQDEIYHNKNDDLFMESMFIEITYEINNKSYVSIFAIKTIIKTIEYKDRETNPH